MAKVTIDGNDYDFDSLSQKAKENIASLQFVQEELKKLNAQIAVYQTASNAYSSVIKEEVDSD